MGRHITRHSLRLHTHTYTHVRMHTYQHTVTLHTLPYTHSFFAICGQPGLPYVYTTPKIAPSHFMYMEGLTAAPQTETLLQAENTLSSLKTRPRNPL